MSGGKCGQGYTLIEMLVVTAILAVLVGVGLAAYSRFEQKQKVEVAALDFAMVLRTAQKKADAGDKPDECTSTLNGYEVWTDGESGTYTNQVDCDHGLKTNRLLENEALFHGKFDVTFLTVGRGVDITNGETVITDKHGSAIYTITVDRGGAITVEKS